MYRSVFGHDGAAGRRGGPAIVLPGLGVWAIVALLSVIGVVWGHADETLAGGETEGQAADALDAPLPNGAMLRLGSLRFRQPSTVCGMALSPDETVIATIGDELIVWDAATGQEHWRADTERLGLRLPAASYGITALAFSPDGKRLYSPGDRDHLLVWDVASGQAEALLIKEPLIGQPAALNQQFGAMFKSIDVFPDGRKLALGSALGVIVCDTSGKKVFSIENAPSKPIDGDAMNGDRLLFGGDYSSAQFSPDGKALAIVTSDGPQTIRMVDADTGNELRRIALSARLVRLVFSPDGLQIAATERDNAVRLYDVGTGNRVWSHEVELRNPYENYTSAIAFAPDGKRIAVCATDNRIHLLDANSGDEPAALEGHNWYPWNVAFTADSRTLYSAGWDGPIRRWNMATGEQNGLPAGVWATGVVGISPDGRLLAYEDDGGKVRLVDAPSGRELRVLELPGTEYSKLTFSPDSRHLAGGGSSGDQVHVALWDVSDGQLIHRWDWPKGRDPHSDVEALRFTVDGERLAAAVFRQSMVYWWDLKTRQQIATQKHEEVYGLSFSPDGQTLATAGWDSVIRFWQADTGGLLREMSLKSDEADGDLRMYSACYSPRGELLATQHMNGEVWLWEAATMKVRTKLKAGSNVGAMNFSPDGLWLATGSRAGGVALWEALTGERVMDVGSHEDGVDTLGFGRDSGQLVSGGGEGVCYLWDLRPPPYEPSKDLAGLWADLSGDNAFGAWRAMWELSADPERAAPFLAEMFSGVRSFMDPDEIGEGVSEKEGKRRRRLKRLLIEREPAVEHRVTAHRAVAVMANLESPLGTRYLKELAAKNPDSDVGRLAAAVMEGDSQRRESE